VRDFGPVFRSCNVVRAAILAALLLGGSAGAAGAETRAAAEIYIREENSRLSVDFVERMIRDAETVFTTTPQGSEKFAAFMHRIGSIREPPASWKDLFFADIHAAPGN
jgi:NitT/TauT family transport system substrate-binding protein